MPICLACRMLLQNFQCIHFPARFQWLENYFFWVLSEEFYRRFYFFKWIDPYSCLFPMPSISNMELFLYVDDFLYFFIVKMQVFYYGACCVWPYIRNRAFN